MNRDRSHGPPGDNAPHGEPRRGGEGRNGGLTGPGEATMSRAEKFEDEKRRIIQTCFSKKDNDGSSVESYITHIRITEDAAHPSTPPPPTSLPENKKARVIIVAVRRSGRVRMHKARENNDGSFSIGKTWMLDDLSAIQSYSGFAPSTPVEAQHKQWAATVGFMVTVGKPYYWHARSSKEKEFFIGSLVKIYRKYTGGKIPNLIGFDDRERQLLIGAPTTGPPGSRGAGQGPPGTPSSQDGRSQSPHTSRAPSRDGPREFRRQPSEERLRAQRSRDQMQRPSTAQSGKSVNPPPFGPPPLPLPGIPTDQQDLLPPRSNERLAADSRIPKVPVLQPPEPRHKGSSIDLAASDARPSSSPSGKTVPESRPPLRSQDSSSSSHEVKHSKDGLRPTTPAALIPAENRNVRQGPPSGLDLKSPLNESREEVPIPEAPADSRPKDALATPMDMHSPDIPPALRPASSRGNIVPNPPATIEAVETTTPVATREPEPSRPVQENLPTSLSVSPPEPPKPEEVDPDAHRPGLGPMIKKKSTKDVAGAFRKAATAYGAFKPRPGGAGERLLAAAKKQQSVSDEPDGITSVVPAPSLRTGNDPTNVVLPGTPDKETPPVLETPPLVAAPPNEPPKIEIRQATITDETTITSVEAQPELRDVSIAAVQIVADEKVRTLSPSPNGRRRRREDNTLKYCQALGIDLSILEGRGADFDDILTDLGWNGRLNDEKKIEDLEADIRREIGRVEATSWLGNLEQQEGKVDQLAKLIDKTIEECEELDGLLTLYSHELNTLHDDVSFIETQSQGLQVQTANQKLLHNELQNLLKTLSISSTDLQPLKEASLSNTDGLRDAEVALSTLYKAMLTIDSDIWQNKKRLADAAGDHGSVGVYADTEIGQMRAIKEKKEEYRMQSRVFLQRLKQFMAIAYQVAEQKRMDAVSNSAKDSLKLDSEARAYFRQELWVYNALILFAREVSGPEWHGLINLYEQKAKLPYQNDFRDNNLAWKRDVRKPTGEEQELLFTHQDKEKETEGITMAARKLTVRRGKTIKAARLSLGDKQSGKLDPCEVFAGVLQETLNMISEEQNFVVHFFHLSSLANIDFTDLVASGKPDERQRPDFRAKQLHDPDRELAKKVEQIMDEIYAFWPTDMQNLVDWAIKADPIQGIGILFALEKAMTDYDDTNQDFIIHSLQKLHSRLIGLFKRFVDEQIRGIEDTKVKVNKRKGVISFMRVFPNFSAAVENVLSQPGHEFCDIRISVNEAYNRINRAMWESLKFIAKEAPTGAAVAAASAGDPEDKEVLNYHILLIENMNHYIEEVDVRGLPVLEKWRERAHQDFMEHMKLYLDSVIHRPLGKLLEFVESTEGLIGASSNPTDIAIRPSHSRAVAKKVLAMYDAKEIRRGVEMLKKRVEKHFGDADDPGLSRSLVLKVLRECERRYEDAYDRTRRIVDAVYEGQLEMEWRKDDAIAMFKK